MTDDPLDRALLLRLGAQPTPTQRRRLALDLRAKAERQEAIAEAEEREQSKPPHERLAPKDRRGQGRKPGDFVRIERVARAAPKGQSQDRDVERSALRRGIGQPKLRIYVGRALYYAAGAPARIGVVLDAGQLRLVPAQMDEGFAVIVGSGIPRFWCASLRGALKDFADGRYAAEVRAGAIIVGAPIDDAYARLDRFRAATPADGPTLAEQLDADRSERQRMIDGE